MSIFIGRRPETAFTRVPNEWARDPKLSLKAKGLLTYLLSHEDGYRLTMEQVIAETKEGKAAVYTAVKELIEHEYLRRSQDRLPGGKVGELHYYVADAPAQTASQFAASRKSESGHDQAKQDVPAGETASRFSGSGFSACGKSTTKKTKVLENQNQEDQNTTSPHPSLLDTRPVVVDAVIVEAAEDRDASLEIQLQKLIDDVQAIRPTWSATELRTHISAAHASLGDFEAVTVLALNTARDLTSARPSRITASGNPHLLQVNTALMVARTAATPNTRASTHPDAHPFVASTGSPACGRCQLPQANERHRTVSQGGGYVGRPPARRSNNQPWLNPSLEEQAAIYDPAKL